jgi:hypothetical protein
MAEERDDDDFGNFQSPPLENVDPTAHQSTSAENAYANTNADAYSQDASSKSVKVLSPTSALNSLLRIDDSTEEQEEASCNDLMDHEQHPPEFHHNDDDQAIVISSHCYDPEPPPPPLDIDIDPHSDELNKAERQDSAAHLWVESPNSAFETMRTVSATNNDKTTTTTTTTTTIAKLYEYKCKYRSDGVHSLSLMHRNDLTGSQSQRQFRFEGCLDAIFT